MNVKVTDNLIKFFIFAGVGAYSAILYNNYKKEELKRSNKKSERVETLSDEKININNLVKSDEELDEYKKLSFIRKVHWLANADCDIDKDDLINDDMEINSKSHHMRVEDYGENKISLKIQLPLGMERKYSEVADKILSEFKSENDINPFIHKEGYVYTEDESNEGVCWYEITGYQKFSDLVKKAKEMENDNWCMFYTVEFRKDKITPPMMEGLIEKLLNNEDYEEGVNFGPVVFVDEDYEI